MPLQWKRRTAIPPEPFTFDLTALEWLVAGSAAFVIGLSKTGIPGLGILAVTLLTTAMPQHSKAAVGAMLPMLLVGDVFAVVYWHRKAQWKILWRILPPAAVGIIAGYFLLGVISDEALKRTIGGIVVGLIALQAVRDAGCLADERVPHHWAVAWVFGASAGVITMLSNAAGPIIIIFLLAMNLDRFKFIGTIAWYFLLLNAVKVPFFVYRGMIGAPSLVFNAKLVALVLAGCLVGLFAPKYISEKPFRWTIIVLAAGAGLKLLIWG